MIKIEGNEYPTVDDAAKEFNVTPKTIYKWIEKGIIPPPPTKFQGMREVRLFTEEYMIRAREAVKKSRKKS